MNGTSADGPKITPSNETPSSTTHALKKSTMG